MSSANLLILLGGLLVLSAMLAAMETALFSVPRPRAKRFAHMPGPPGDVFRRLIESPHAVLVQILLGNTLVNVAATAVAALLLDRLVRRFELPEWSVMGVETLGMTVVILIFCEVTPKTLAFERNEALAPAFARLYAILRPALAPVAGTLEGLAGLTTRFVKGRASEPLSADELETLVEVGAREGTLNPEESRIFRGAFRLGEKTVGEIMVPRADVVFVAAGTPVAEAIELVVDGWRARIPVYEGTLERVVGVLYAKDLLPLAFDGADGRTVREVMRAPYLVPRERRLDELLPAFQAARVHLAVVVDGAGRALGIVTLEDVLEEIVGPIEDELEREEPAVLPLGEGRAVFRGSVAVEEANRLLGVRLPGRPGETLAEFCGRMRTEAPAEGEGFVADGAVLTVEAVTGRQVWSVRVERT